MKNLMFYKPKDSQWESLLVLCLSETSNPKAVQPHTMGQRTVPRTDCSGLPCTCLITMLLAQIRPWCMECARLVNLRLSVVESPVVFLWVTKPLENPTTSVNLFPRKTCVHTHNSLTCFFFYIWFQEVIPQVHFNSKCKTPDLIIFYLLGKTKQPRSPVYHLNFWCIRNLNVRRQTLEKT